MITSSVPRIPRRNHAIDTLDSVGRSSDNHVSDPTSNWTPAAPVTSATRPETESATDMHHSTAAGCEAGADAPSDRSLILRL